MTNIEIARMQLDALIVGMESNSSIPVQLSELKMLAKLIAEVPMSNNSSALRAVRMNLFPVADSLQSAFDKAMSALPITDKNVLNALLMTYHNTLIQTLESDNHVIHKRK